MRFWLLIFFIPVFASAQLLPKPASVVYRCQIDGKTVYSDDPCPGAKVVDATPNSGVDRLSGKSVVGQDVHQERFHRQLGEALRPLGSSPERFPVEMRRAHLSPEAKLSCGLLDSAIPGMMKDEGKASGQDLKRVQGDLYRARLRYRELRC